MRHHKRRSEDVTAKKSQTDQPKQIRPVSWSKDKPDQQRSGPLFDPAHDFLPPRGLETGSPHNRALPLGTTRCPLTLTRSRPGLSLTKPGQPQAEPQPSCHIHEPRNSAADPLRHPRRHPQPFHAIVLVTVGQLGMSPDNHRDGPVPVLAGGEKDVDIHTILIINGLPDGDGIPPTRSSSDHAGEACWAAASGPSRNRRENLSQAVPPGPAYRECTNGLTLEALQQMISFSPSLTQTSPLESTATAVGRKFPFPPDGRKCDSSMYSPAPRSTPFG